MRIRVTNESQREGSLLIDAGNDEDSDQPPRLKKLAAGASVELRVTQRGHIVVVGFKARVVPLARGIRNAVNPTKANRPGKEVRKHG